ncbi:MAG: ribosome biogenesis GTPase Der [Pseudomonadota bacterium]
MRSYIAIVGRPNVGKSTLFNQITHSTKALVDNLPGVTRDRLYADVEWNEKKFVIIDTAGFSDDQNDPLTKDIRENLDLGVQEADILMCVFNAKDGLTPGDIAIVDYLRRIQKPTLYIVNKVDTPKHESLLPDFYSLGQGTLYPISAAHRSGIDDVMDALSELIPLDTENPADENNNMIRISVMGRPNVGKSSLINRLLATDRVLVSEMPGTTRDAVDIDFTFQNKAYRLIDTAGIRKKTSVYEKLEKLSVIKSLKAIEQCHIALMVIDASEGVTGQDIAVGSYIAEQQRGTIIVLNKWDIATKGKNALTEYTHATRDRMKFLSFAPIVNVSALTGQNVLKIFNLANQVYNEYNTHISTSQVNKMFHEAFTSHPPPAYKHRPVKCYYATQSRVRPPTFLCFVNKAEGIAVSYGRYLVNQIRLKSKLKQTPVKIIFKNKS